MTAGLVGHWLSTGALDLPLPGSGETARRWQRLAELTEIDVVAGRLAEAHTDAVAILAELGGPDPHPDQLWGVWAAESRDAVLCAHGGDDEVKLEGTKVWCSGAGLCTHALVTARLDNGRRALVRGRSARRGRAAAAQHLAQLRDGRLGHPLGAVQRRPGDRRRRTRCVPGPARLLARRDRGRRVLAGRCPRRRGAAVRTGGRRLRRPAHAGPPRRGGRRDRRGRRPPWKRRHARSMRTRATGPAPPNSIARRTRAVVETAVDEAITRTGRALGPGPLCQDAQHARRVADLTIYVRQSHAERDLEVLGRLAGAKR